MRRVLSFVPDVAGLAGVASVSYGAWLIFEPAGFIVGGILTLIGAVLAARTQRGPE